MTMAIPAEAGNRRTPRVLIGDMAAALACIALYGLLLTASRMLTGLELPADNDSMLRLVMVRDLLNGQGWFDPQLSRMGLEGGFPMHWSRLVDAPIAAIILAGNALGLDGEGAAAIVWPLTLMALALFAVIRAARAYGGEAATLPAAIIGTVTFYSVSIFSIGQFDHHNVQLTLALFLLLAFLHDRKPLRRGLLAGFMAAGMLAVGMETTHFVAAAGAGAVLVFVLEGAGGRRFAGGFGLAFAGGLASAFFITVGPAAWGAVACDALSSVHLVLGSLAGIGLAVIAGAGANRTPPARMMLSGALAILLGVAAVTLYPNCLAAPYAGLDPLLHDFWLDHVIEARPALSFLGENVPLVASRLATPLVALGVVVWQARKGGFAHKHFVLGAFLLAATLITVWQVRGSNFAVAIAVVPLATLVAGLRQRATADRAATADTLKMALGWLVSVNLVWGSLASLAFPPAKAAQMRSQVASAGAAPSAAIKVDPNFSECLNAQALDDLNRLSPQTILAVSNLGSALLLHTNHRTLSGPYHRNIAGNLAAIKAFTGAPEEARRIAREAGATLFVHCAGNPETAFFAARRREGMLGQVVAGKVPDWLEPVLENGAISAWRIR
ncbi:MAG: GtrA family protein [Notoacmeibacter sp.]|nr:GtrA family protein [Notoacmeibacter sp.]MCC0031634.1 GtrA family protein [Brucellaceae bacterium]